MSEADSDKTVEQYETFVNDVLRTKLKNCLDRREEVCNDIREYSELRNTIFNLRDLDSKPLKTQVDLGCNFFVQAEVSDLSKIFTAVGFGFFLELTPEESLNFIDKKIAFLNKSVEHLNEQAAAIKADIRMILDILGELQKIKVIDANTHKTRYLICSPLALKKKCRFYLLPLIFTATIFLCLVLKAYFFIYTIIPFHNMEENLFTTLHTNVTGLCEHRLAKFLSHDELQVELNVTDSHLQLLNNSVKVGGVWSPLNCNPKYHVNVIVPFRKRERQLMIFLHHLHQFLQRQEIGYRITIVEQVAGKDFNRAKLFNIGFIELERRFPTDCYIFHDVDLVPLRANNMYACTLQPRHMSSSINVFNYQLPYSQLFGGAVALLSKQFRRINGYSNEFFGWGGEDDDFYNRLRRSGLPLVRFEQDISRYIMIDHAKESPNPDRFEMLRHGRWRYDNDGLNDLHYAVDDFELRPLYTWILVEL